MVSAVPASAYAGSGDAGAPISVMTRNMYLGTDLAPLIGAQTPEGFVAAAAAGYGQVLASNVPERAAGLAKEIKSTRPDVVSLQEVYLWRTGPVLDPSPATHVTVDALASLQAALTAEGLRYTPAVVQENADLEAPVPVPGIYADVRLTDRDVILVRADLPSSVLSVSNPQKGQYSVILKFTSDVLGEVSIGRGWVSVDITRSGHTTRVINTHLESYAPAIPGTALIQRAQGAELLGRVIGATHSPVILSGDFNSGPSKPGAIDDPPIDPFNDIVAAGFVDTWSDTRPFLPGYTWPINNGDSRTAAVPDQRIDHVFVRGSVRPLVDVRTGGSKTPSGLFVSDHLGLVAYAWLHN
jgi:endonuclease/exonuclease/phosphatase family metal-dependent hydrolase